MIYQFLSSLEPKNEKALQRLNDRMGQFYSQATDADYWETGECINEAWHPEAHPFHCHLRDLIPPDATIVDFGCGSGHPARNLGQPHRYIGIDWGEVQIKLNQQTYPEAQFVASSIYNTPLASDSVDWAVSFYVLEHCVWPQRMLDEMYRVVRPGGHIAIICPNCRPHPMPSIWPGLKAAAGIRQKLKHFNLFDLALHVLDRKLLIPWLCQLSNQSNQRFLIYPEPACLYDADWRPDIDAIYWADQPEVEQYLIGKGGSLVANRDQVDANRTETLFCVVRKAT